MLDQARIARQGKTEMPRHDSDGYFSHHGPWAFGVKLFRALGFTPKAMLISAVFLVPLALVLFVYLQKQIADESFARTELQGVAAIQAYVPVIRQVIELRNATRAKLANFEGAAPVADVQHSLDQAIGDFHKYLAQSADPLGIESRFAEFERAYAEARSKGVLLDSASGGTIWDPLAANAKSLEQDLADKSNLSLDPDADTYYLQAVVAGEISSVAVNLGQIRAWSVWFALKSHGTEREQRNYAIWDSRVTEHIDILRDDLSRAIAADPQISINLAPLEIVESYQSLAGNSALGAAGADPKILWNEGSQAVDALFAVYAQGLPLLHDLLQARVDRSAQERTTILGVFGICVALAGYLFYSFYLVMMGGLKEVRRHLEAMTAGDLTTTAHPWGRDELASLMLSLSDMQASLRTIVGQVRSSSSSIVTASDEIAAASQDLSGRTEKTAADLARDAASMATMSAAVKSSAGAATRASDIALENATVASRGQQVIHDVVETMNRIDQSSRKIEEIIGTIDGIAFQTNILALNAAVEAARAGEQGRGFAVVASEVRNLAQRSAEASKQIKTLITNGVAEVAAGTRVVEGAGRTMKELHENADRLNGLLSDISSEAREQSGGLERVGGSIQELDQMTQQNAALVEQTSAASATLHDQARSLSAHVAKFTLPQSA